MCSLGPSTSLYVDGNENLEDVAYFVGHAEPSTTAGYVRRLGRRPEAVARRAASVLDGQEVGRGRRVDLDSDQ